MEYSQSLEIHSHNSIAWLLLWFFWESKISLFCYVFMDNQYFLFDRSERKPVADVSWTANSQTAVSLTMSQERLWKSLRFTIISENINWWFVEIFPRLIDWSVIYKHWSTGHTIYLDVDVKAKWLCDSQSCSGARSGQKAHTGSDWAQVYRKCPAGSWRKKYC